MTLYQKIVRAKLRFPSRFSTEAKALITKLVEVNPAIRIGVSTQGQEVSSCHLSQICGTVQYSRCNCLLIVMVSPSSHASTLLVALRPVIGLPCAGEGAAMVRWHRLGAARGQGAKKSIRANHQKPVWYVACHLLELREPAGLLSAYAKRVARIDPSLMMRPQRICTIRVAPLCPAIRVFFHVPTDGSHFDQYDEAESEDQLATISKVVIPPGTFDAF